MNMSSYEVVANQRIYHVVDDLTMRFGLLVAGRVRSASTGTALRQFDVQVDNDELGAVFVKIMLDGFFALAGNSARLFPDLANTAYQLDLTISAPHYRPLTTSVNIPANSTFPLPELALTLDLQTLRIAGRVTRADNGAAVGNGRVTVQETNVATLRTPLHFDHAAGTVVQPVTLAPNGAGRTLAAEARQSAGELVLDSAAGLGAGVILRLGPPHEFEYVTVDVPGSSPNSLVLRGITRRGFPVGSVVQPVTATPGAPPRALTEDLRAGDGLLLLDGAIAGDALQVEDADPARIEFHALDARTDAQGYYRLDGFGRIRTFTLFAENTASTQNANRTWTIEPLRPVNTVDLSLT